LNFVVIVIGFLKFVVVTVVLVFAGNNKVLLVVTKNETNTTDIIAVTIITITRICCVFITRTMHV
jgi:hypothetical protein